MTEKQFLARAIALALENVHSGLGGPFGAVIARKDVIVGEGTNRVTSTNDPTAHAEIVAIRDACQRAGSFSLAGCVLYSSCEPCPMCLAAVYWARLSAVRFGATQHDAAAAGFDDAFLYRQFTLAPAERSLPVIRLNCPDALEPFSAWAAKADRKPY